MYSKMRKDAFEMLLISHSHVVCISLHGFKMHHGRCTVRVLHILQFFPIREIHIKTSNNMFEIN